MNLAGTVFHPELGQEVSYVASPLSSDPDTQVAQTISRMRRHVIEDSMSAPIQRDAAAIQAQGGDPISDTFWWVKDRVGFRQDEELAAPVRSLLDGDVVEVLIRPRDLLNMEHPLEDCDGFATLAPALLRAQGVPCSFVTVAADTRDLSRFSHVYAACTDPNTGQRVSLDASHGPYPGWECTQTGQVARIQEWPIDGTDWGEILLFGVVLFVAAKLWGLL
jgi:hypothetical protein